MRNSASGTHAHTPKSPRFTPGPWRRIGQRQIVTTAGAGLPICEVWPGGVGIEQADANEFLIAAAPVLYEALADLFDQIAAVGGHSPGGKPFTLDQARAALKLAQGGRS